MEKKTGIFLKIFFYTPLFLLIVVLVLATLFVSLGKNFVRSYENKKEISFLEDEVKRLEGRNKELSLLIDFFKTNSFAEEEARLKFGLGKQGESVIVIPGNNEVDGEKIDKKEQIEEVPNFKKWWYYFFKVNK